MNKSEQNYLILLQLKVKTPRLVSPHFEASTWRFRGLRIDWWRAERWDGGGVKTMSVYNYGNHM
jgi:hypothetical protein